MDYHNRHKLSNWLGKTDVDADFELTKLSHRKTTAFPKIHYELDWFPLFEDKTGNVVLSNLNFDDIPHNARNIHLLQTKFNGRVSRRGDNDWPRKSPDLSPSDFFYGVIWRKVIMSTNQISKLKENVDVQHLKSFAARMVSCPCVLFMK